VKPNVLIVGAAPPRTVSRHKVCPDTRTCWGCCLIRQPPRARQAEKIIESIKRKDNIKDKNARLYAREVDRSRHPAMVKLIQETESAIVINLATPISTCRGPGGLHPGQSSKSGTPVTYMDTAIHEDFRP